MRRDSAIGVLSRKREVNGRFPKLELMKKDKPKSNQYWSRFQWKHFVKHYFLGG